MFVSAWRYRASTISAATSLAVWPAAVQTPKCILVTSWMEGDGGWNFRQNSNAAVKLYHSPRDVSSHEEEEDRWADIFSHCRLHQPHDVYCTDTTYLAFILHIYQLSFTEWWHQETITVWVWFFLIFLQVKLQNKPYSCQFIWYWQHCTVIQQYMCIQLINICYTSSYAKEFNFNM